MGGTMKKIKTLIVILLGSCTINVNNQKTIIILNNKKIMKTTQLIDETQISRNTSIEGEPIEFKMERILNNNERNEDSSPIIFTERKEGVVAEYNPRTDKFEVAIEASEKITTGYLAKRKKAQEERDKKSGDPSQHKAGDSNEPTAA